MSQTITVDGLHFVCDTELEVYRAKTLLTKEPGTIAWLNQLQPGDVFYDVGANIGCYTLYAARAVGESGHVYSFEPHLGNALALIRNVVTNKFVDRVCVYTCALGEKDWIETFFYRQITAGSSGSQVSQPICEGHLFDHVGCEEKIVRTLDSLMSDSLLSWRPTQIKIDVDGREPQIVRGAAQVLESFYIRSVQIETGTVTRDEIQQVMNVRGYYQTSRHFTSAGQQAFNNGIDKDSITDNTIYERVPVFA
jgi:FkbM family methyltransferase